MTMVKLLDEGFAWTRQRVAVVKPAHLNRGTPCAEWNLRRLLEHMLTTMDLMSNAAMNADVAEDGNALIAAGDFLKGDDPLSAFDAVVERALSIWHVPDRLEGTCIMPFGPAPRLMAAQISLNDAVVHAWDIGRTTGEDADIPAGVADELLKIDRRLIASLGGRGGLFGEEIDIRTSSASDRLVAYLGRTP